MVPLSISSSSAVQLDEDLTEMLSSIATNLDIKYKVMPSGAGHDAMKFAGLAKTGMIFVPCKGGISHNPEEEADLKDAAIGSQIIFEYLNKQIL